MFEEDNTWITQTAETLVCDFLSQMADIHVRRLPETSINSGMTMDAVYVHIRGDFRMEVQLRAEAAMFYRLTRNIGGEEPLSEDEVREYATEFFNVLCGRFLSELCNRNHILMRFDPPQYQKSASIPEAEESVMPHTLAFETEKKERLEFSWGIQMMNQLQKRSGEQ